MAETYATKLYEAGDGGGIKAVKKFTGRLVEIKPPFAPTFNPDLLQIEANFEDVVVLEMFDNEDIFVPKDGKFKVWEKYAAKGHKPTSGSTYMRCWVHSAAEIHYARYQAAGGEKSFKDWVANPDLSKGPTELIGEVVTMEKQPRVLFPDTKHPIVGADGSKTYPDVLAVDQKGKPNHWCFASDAPIDPAAMAEKVRAIVAGKTLSSALRALMLDPQAGLYGEYATQLENDPEGFAKTLGLTIKGEVLADN